MLLRAAVTDANGIVAKRAGDRALGPIRPPPTLPDWIGLERGRGAAPIWPPMDDLGAPPDACRSGPHAIVALATGTGQAMTPARNGASGAGISSTGPASPTTPVPDLHLRALFRRFWPTAFAVGWKKPPGLHRGRKVCGRWFRRPPGWPSPLGRDGGAGGQFWAANAVGWVFSGLYVLGRNMGIMGAYA